MPEADPAGTSWHADHLELQLELAADEVVVTCTTHVRRSAATTAPAPLVLDGAGLVTREVTVDGTLVSVDGETTPDGVRLELGDRSLVLHLPGGHHTVRTVVSVRPGPVGTKGITAGPRLVSTNCEPQGFRRITWSLDHPANRATYDVTLVADPTAYRTLLANGDLVDRGTLADGRHWARFVDPVTKPSYLFAAVAGDLDVVSAPYTTCSGRNIQLRVAALPEQIDGADFALRTMATTIAFDEAMGGIEHDLDHLTFVAVPGYPDATEYHGLMFFDPALLVVDRRGATDDDLLLVMANIAHEYGHHVRGNRVTVRTWGQLALKEGLTVLTGQNDTRRHHFGAVGRVLDVLDLRRLQFPEEVTIGAPVVRGEVPNPESLYTRTTYLKGAEVFGMMRTLLGPERWPAAFDAFIRRFDLDSAGVEDFVDVMCAECPDLADDVRGIARWFGLAGRPALSVSSGSDEHGPFVRIDRTDALTDEPPVSIPVVVGFRDDDGRSIAVGVDGSAPVATHTAVLRSRSAVLRLDADRPPVLSALRGYSAPVDLTLDTSDAHLATLLVHDDDAVVRWWSAQELMIRSVDDVRAGRAEAADRRLDVLAGALRTVVAGDEEPMLLAQLLSLPDEYMLGDREPRIDVDGVANGLAVLRRRLGTELHDDLLAVLHRGGDDPEGTHPSDIAVRSLVEPCLALLLAAGTTDSLQAAEQQLAHPNATRAVRALAQLMHLDAVGGEVVPGERVDEWVAATYERWHDAPALLDRWLRAQSGGRRADTIERVRALRNGPLYDRHRRGRVMGLWFPFATRNRSVFHHPSGAGYRLFVDEVIELMPIDAGLVVRLVGDLLQFHRFDDHRRELLRAELERMADAPGMPDFAVGIVRGLLAR